MRELEHLEGVLNYKFKDQSILRLALTHSSYANELRDKSSDYNERLEFLGDSVLGIVISEYVYSEHPDFKEGELTKMRSKIVCESTLAEVAAELDLGEYMLFGKGEALTGGRTRRSILADAFEALIAAIYLDGGFEIVKPFIYAFMQEKIDMAEKGLIVDDYKTHLQELIQTKKDNRIKYELMEENGPDHRKLFRTAVKLNGNVIGIGEGRSKKESEQEAAKMALRSGKFEETL
ncbi:MAG: ribonuclease III [Clostridiales bacterium]|nr:ribonuclease III [Clostridiales bacterium]